MIEIYCEQQRSKNSRIEPRILLLSINRRGNVQQEAARTEDFV